MTTARSRTLQRLKYLAALSAAGIAAACSGGKSDDGGTGTSSSGGGSSGGPFDAGRDGSSGGVDAYGVVDPLPPPSCFRNSVSPDVTAKYIQNIPDAGGDVDAGNSDDRYVQIDIEYTGNQATFNSNASAMGATIISNNITATGGTILISVSATTTNATVVLPCSQLGQSPGSLSMRLTFNATTVTVLVSDY